MAVAVAMSGGVDSSLAAVLAISKYGKANVFGITMDLFCDKENVAISDAKTVCKQLGINHSVVNLHKEFEEEVIANFVSEYDQGRTPNPCVRCNKLIKFGLLLERAQELGADMLVTGHYARVVSDLANSKQRTVNIKSDSKNSSLAVKYKLLKGLDESKDQSYFLYSLTQKQLRHIWFPLGEMKKSEVRNMSNEYGLKTAQKDESQDVCFINGSTQKYLERKISQKPGDIVNISGQVVGKHKGLAGYTIGQRKGLGGGFSEIMYVTGLNNENNEVVIGPEKDLYKSQLGVSKPHWIVEMPAMPLKCKAQIRYASDAVNCVVSSSSSLSGAKDLSSAIQPRNDSVLVAFNGPQKAVTKGQSVVFYIGEEVTGGGIIS